MINIQKFVYNPFQENTYILSDRSKECLIIDAGCMEAGEKSELEAWIAAEELKPVALVNTHCHVDHILGVAFLAEKYNIPFRIHKEEKTLFEHSRSQAEFFGLSLDDPPQPEGFLEEGDTLRFGESELQVIHVPGHSPGSLLFHDHESKILVSGDVLFLNSIGRSDLPFGDHDLLVNGIKQKILTLDPETIVYPGHGPQTSVREEKSNNPFLA